MFRVVFASKPGAPRGSPTLWIRCADSMIAALAAVVQHRS